MRKATSTFAVLLLSLIVATTAQSQEAAGDSSSIRVIFEPVVDTANRDKLVIIMHWATWCRPHCYNALEVLYDLHASSESVEFVSVTYGDERPALNPGADPVVELHFEDPRSQLEYLQAVEDMTGVELQGPNALPAIDFYFNGAPISRGVGYTDEQFVSRIVDLLGTAENGDSETSRRFVEVFGGSDSSGGLLSLVLAATAEN